MSYSDFEALKEIINDQSCMDIRTWSRVEDFDGLGMVSRKDCPFAGKSGIYTVIDAEGHIAYIGKAKCLFNRLSSHSKALKGGDEFKAPIWHQFFTSINHDGLEARYLVIDGFSPSREEYARQVIERALQIKYKPYFDELFVKKTRIEDFDGRLLLVKQSLTTL